MKLNKKQMLESRIREIKRKLLHTRDKDLRGIYRDHIDYLQSQI